MSHAIPLMQIVRRKRKFPQLWDTKIILGCRYANVYSQLLSPQSYSGELQGYQQSENEFDRTVAPQQLLC
jgi:ribosomal protein L20